MQFVGSHTVPSVVHNMGHVEITVITINVKRHDFVCVGAELHCNICKEIGENLDTKQFMTMYRNW